MKETYNVVEELISDESFISWFHRFNDGDIKKWDGWIAENPDKQPLVNEAVRLLSYIKFEDVPVSEQMKQDAEAKLRQAISSSASAKVIPIKRKRIWYAAAAAAALLIALSLTLFLSPIQKLN